MMSRSDEDVPARANTAADIGLIDYSPRRISADATLHDATRVLVESAAWGVPLVERDDQYVGMLTLRSVVSPVLPVVVNGDPLREPGEIARGLIERLRLDHSLDLPARHAIDLEVPVVRLSTKLPQLLAALCRRAPMVPIVADTGMRLVGVASLARAARLLHGR